MTVRKSPSLPPASHIDEHDKNPAEAKLCCRVSRLVGIFFMTFPAPSGANVEVWEFARRVCKQILIRSLEEEVGRGIAEGSLVRV